MLRVWDLGFSSALHLSSCYEYVRKEPAMLFLSPKPKGLRILFSCWELHTSQRSAFSDTPI